MKNPFRLHPAKKESHMRRQTPGRKETLNLPLPLMHVILNLNNNSYNNAGLHYCENVSQCVGRHVMSVESENPGATTSSRRS